MASDKPGAPPRRSATLAAGIVLAVAVAALLLCRSTALRVRYHVWRLSGELGAAQQRSVDALVAIGPPAVRALGRALSSDREATVNAAIKALGQIDAPEARAALVTALGHEAGDVRFAAIFALLGTSDPAVLPAFRGALGDRRADVRRMAVFAFKGYPAEMAIPELIQVLKASDQAVRDEAASRLGDFAEADVLPKLFDGLRNDPALAPGARQVVILTANEDPGSEAQALLDWWEANRRGFAPQGSSDAPVGGPRPP